MLRKFLLSLFFIVIAFSQVEALPPTYARVWVGVNYVHDSIPHVDIKYDLGVGTGLAVGMYCWEWLRFEIEGDYRFNKIDDIRVDGLSSGISGDVHDWAVLFNTIVDICPCWIVCPYVGIGLGYGWERASLSGPRLDLVRESDSEFVYQPLVGLRYQVFECTDVTLEYRFLPYETDVYSHSFAFGLCQHF
jgi:opacity protein-like surface antigen